MFEIVFSTVSACFMLVTESVFSSDFGLVSSFGLLRR